MASVLMIAASSSALFVYWFRYTCLLLLAQKQSPEYALKVASTVRLNFQVQEELEAQPDQLDLDRLYAGLEDDYRMLTDLLRQVTGSESIDEKRLVTDYKAMQVWYKLARGPGRGLYATKPLTEMSAILGYFAAELSHNAAA